jgi:signal transduction histidine kinase
MSFVEKLGLRDGEATEAAYRATREKRRSRLHLVYFALAAFDVIAISCTLFLSHSIMTAYEGAVHTSRRWAAHVGDIAVLGELARQTNAPGNDVFESGNVPVELARRDLALAKFDAQWEKLRTEIADSASASDKVVFAQSMASIRSSMDAMVLEADGIFQWIGQGDEDRAGQMMASMDRTYGHLTRSILDAVNTVQAIQIEHLEYQVDVAKDLRILESIIGGLIVIIVISVAIYGSKIAAVMRQNEERHDVMIAQLEAAQDALRYYADNVAHELRSPVNKILVGSEVVLSRPRTREEYQEALLSNMEECQSLARIVESLLFMAKAEHVQGQLNRQPTHVAHELGLIATFFEGTAAEAGVRVSVSCAPDLVFDLDRVLFQRAISNIVSNAIAHTDGGGEVRLLAELHEDELHVQIDDTGEGIPEHARERVFDRFYRADQARSSTSGRFGLGLPITKSIVALHGGAIALASEVGRGTTVTLRFPQGATTL